MSVFESIKNRIKKESIKGDQVWLDDVTFLECLASRNKSSRFGRDFHFVVPFVLDKKTQIVTDLRTNKTYACSKDDKLHKNLYQLIVEDYVGDIKSKYTCNDYSFRLFSAEATSKRVFEQMKEKDAVLAKTEPTETKRYVPTKEVVEFCDEYAKLKAELYQQLKKQPAKQKNM